MPKPCLTVVDSNHRELTEHGSVGFPIAYYDVDLSRGDVQWHWHEEVEVMVVREGCCTVAAGTEKHLLRPGEGFVFNSGSLHGCWDAENSGCRFYSLVFHPRLVGGSLDSVFYKSYVQPVILNHTVEGLALKPETRWQQEALKAIEQAWQAVAGRARGYEFRVRAALSELILLLEENLPNAQKQPSVKSLRDGERIKKMIQYIHDHCGEQLSIQSIAAAAAVSESECLRCFRNTIGTTPIQYARQHRIQKAAQMLTTTDAQISAIAESCGFQDVSYFTKTFREMKGCAPTEYRRKSGV